VVGTAHDRALSIDGGPMLAIGGKWRIPNGKVRDWSVVMFRAPKVVASTYVDYGLCQLGLNEQALIMYWCIHDLLGPTNLVASCVAEFDDTLPYLTGV
jgi:hypothetical protein